MRSLHDKSMPGAFGLLSKLATYVAVIAALGFHCEPALAQSLPELRLCPRAIVNTCFIGDVTSASKMIVMLSSRDSDPLVGEEVEVDATPSGAVATTLDKSKQIDSVVMLDATGTDRITSAKLVWVADPLLTALYMSTFLQPPPDAATPQ